MSFALEVKQVTVAFGAHTVLSHITFALIRGEIGCLLGPSGCGKTSLLRAIAGFESPPVGEIWINGALVNARSNPIPTERRKVGMVFQDFALFPSLDVELREQIAKEVRTILKQEGITAILVSHNQLETFAMADQIGVINQGRLLQWDTAYNLYHRPCCRYVADFIGEGVFLAGTVTGADEVRTELGPLRGRMTVTLPTGAPVDVLIHPDDVVHDEASPLTATVLDKVFRGAEFLYTLGLPSGTTLLALVPSHHNHALHEPIGIRLEPDHLVLFEHHAARLWGGLAQYPG